MGNKGDYSAEFLTALHDSVSPRPTDSIVDTSSSEERGQRATQEVYIREHLSAVFGLSFYERMVFIRQHLFHANVRGDQPAMPRQGDLGGGIFPDGAAAEYLYP